MDPNIVSEEAGKLYTELQVSNSFHCRYSLACVSFRCFACSQALIQTHGEGAVESVVPIFVWVLEGLARCKTQLRDKEVEVERERSEREHLLERYQAERTLRKECQEVGSHDDLAVNSFIRDYQSSSTACCLRNTWSWMIKLNTRGERRKGGKRRDGSERRNWRRRRDNRLISVSISALIA